MLNYLFDVRVRTCVLPRLRRRSVTAHKIFVVVEYLPRTFVIFSCAHGLDFCEIFFLLHTEKKLRKILEFLVEIWLIHVKDESKRHNFHHIKVIRLTRINSDCCLLTKQYFQRDKNSPSFVPIVWFPSKWLKTFIFSSL